MSAAGFCACGCGQATKIAYQSDKRYGSVQGQPRRFVHGHQNRDHARHVPDPARSAAPDEQSVPNFPGYRASPRGEIRGPRQRLLAEEKIKGGYRRVSMVDDEERRRHVLVHRAVAATFLGPCPQGHEVNHKNGDTADNRVDNLEYRTASENVRHSIDVLGRVRAPGEKNANASLTDNAVRAMRAAAAAGLSNGDIALRFGIGYSQTCRVVSGRAWRHVL